MKNYSSRTLVCLIAFLFIGISASDAQNREGEITRADIMAMSPVEQREVFANYTKFTIVDLINLNRTVANNRSSLVYLTDEDFNALNDPNRQIQIITHPNEYIIVDTPSQIPW